MLRNYLVISFRNIVKNKWFSLINLAGLAVGMACFVLILAYVRFELSCDRFHEKSDRIFRVISREASPRADVIEFSDGSPDVLAAALAADIPEINRTTRICTFFGEEVVLQSDEKCFVESGLFADEHFLEIFSFPLLQGDEKNALIAPGSIVITENMARKLFGDADPFGKSVVYKSGSLRYDLTVTGLLIKVPPQIPGRKSVDGVGSDGVGHAKHAREDSPA
jgi:putative ABC transport system permease protein